MSYLLSSNTGLKGNNFHRYIPLFKHITESSNNKSRSKSSKPDQKLGNQNTTSNKVFKLDTTT